MSTVYAAAYDGLLQVLPRIGVRKNLSLTPDWCESLATLALQNLSDHELRGFLRAEPGAIALAVNTVSYLIDILMIGQLCILRLQNQGREVPDLAVIFARAEKALNRMVANDDQGEPKFVIWPDQEKILAAALAPQTLRQINFRLPKGSHRASFKLDAKLQAVTASAVNNDMTPHDEPNST